MPDIFNKEPFIIWVFSGLLAILVLLLICAAIGGIISGVRNRTRMKHRKDVAAIAKHFAAIHASDNSARAALQVFAEFLKDEHSYHWFGSELNQRISDFDRADKLKALEKRLDLEEWQAANPSKPKPPALVYVHQTTFYT